MHAQPHTTSMQAYAYNVDVVCFLKGFLIEVKKQSYNALR